MSSRSSRTADAHPFGSAPICQPLVQLPDGFPGRLGDGSAERVCFVLLPHVGAIGTSQWGPTIHACKDLLLEQFPKNRGPIRNCFVGSAYTASSSQSFNARTCRLAALVLMDGDGQDTDAVLEVMCCCIFAWVKAKDGRKECFQLVWNMTRKESIYKRKGLQSLLVAGLRKVALEQGNRHAVMIVNVMDEQVPKLFWSATGFVPPGQLDYEAQALALAGEATWFGSGTKLIWAAPTELHDFGRVLSKVSEKLGGQALKWDGDIAVAGAASHQLSHQQPQPQPAAAAVAADVTSVRNTAEAGVKKEEDVEPAPVGLVAAKVAAVVAAKADRAPSSNNRTPSASAATARKGASGQEAGGALKKAARPSATAAALLTVANERAAQQNVANRKQLVAKQRSSSSVSVPAADAAAGGMAVAGGDNGKTKVARADGAGGTGRTNVAGGTVAAVTSEVVGVKAADEVAQLRAQLQALQLVCDEKSARNKRMVEKGRALEAKLATEQQQRAAALEAAAAAAAAAQEAHAERVAEVDRQLAAAKLTEGVAKAQAERLEREVAAADGRARQAAAVQAEAEHAAGKWKELAQRLEAAQAAAAEQLRAVKSTADAAVAAAQSRQLNSFRRAETSEAARSLAAAELRRHKATARARVHALTAQSGLLLLGWKQLMRLFVGLSAAGLDNARTSSRVSRQPSNGDEYRQGTGPAVLPGITTEHVAVGGSRVPPSLYDVKVEGAGTSAHTHGALQAAESYGRAHRRSEPPPVPLQMPPPLPQPPWQWPGVPELSQNDRAQGEDDGVQWYQRALAAAQSEARDPATPRTLDSERSLEKRAGFLSHHQEEPLPQPSAPSPPQTSRTLLAGADCSACQPSDPPLQQHPSLDSNRYDPQSAHHPPRSVPIMGSSTAPLPASVPHTDDGRNARLGAVSVKVEAPSTASFDLPQPDSKQHLRRERSPDRAREDLPASRELAAGRTASHEHMRRQCTADHIQPHTDEDRRDRKRPRPSGPGQHSGWVESVGGRSEDNSESRRQDDASSGRWDADRTGRGGFGSSRQTVSTTQGGRAEASQRVYDSARGTNQDHLGREQAGPSSLADHASTGQPDYGGHRSDGAVTPCGDRYQQALPTHPPSNRPPLHPPRGYQQVPDCPPPGPWGAPPAAAGRPSGDSSPTAASRTLGDRPAVAPAVSTWGAPLAVAAVASPPPPSPWGAPPAGGTSGSSWDEEDPAMFSAPAPLVRAKGQRMAPQQQAVFNRQVGFSNAEKRRQRLAAQRPMVNG